MGVGDLVGRLVIGPLITFWNLDVTKIYAVSQVFCAILIASFPLVVNGIQMVFQGFLFISQPFLVLLSFSLFFHPYLLLRHFSLRLYFSPRLFFTKPLFFSTPIFH